MVNASYEMTTVGFFFPIPTKKGYFECSRISKKI